ncbi:MAG: diguanylate cyclase [Thermodesulfobacteriota bacterium]
MDNSVFKEGAGGPGILDVTPDAVIAADERQRITFWNPSAGLMFGYSREEALGLALTELMPEEYRKKHRRGFEKFLETGRPTVIGKTVELKGRRKDGSLFPLELSLAAERQGEGWNFTAIIRDITARKNTEKRTLKEKKNLDEINSELSILHDISKVLASTLDKKELFLRVLKTITGIKLFKLESSGGVFIVEGDKMELVAHLGHANTFLELHKGIHVGECLCGMAAKTGELIYSASSVKDERHTIRYPGLTDHGHVIVPLKAQGEVVGVLYLYLPAGACVEESKKNLLRSIGNQLGMAISNLKLFDKTKELTLKDPLTGIANRRYIDRELKKSLHLSKRTNSPFSIIMIDIDFFKKYNDTYGHVAGDNLLKDISIVFLKALRETDLVGRYGGEEFLALLPDTDLLGACNVAERIRKAVKAKTGVTVSLGVAGLQKEVRDWKEILILADTALYRAKENGRNRVEFIKQKTLY